MYKELGARRAIEYALVIVLSAAGVALASGLELHTSGTVVAAGTANGVKLPFTVTLDGKPFSGNVSFLASVIGLPPGQCNVALNGPIRNILEPGLYSIYAGIGTCPYNNMLRVWRKGRTAIRIRAATVSSNSNLYGEAVAGIDAQ